CIKEHNTKDKESDWTGRSQQGRQGGGILLDHSSCVGRKSVAVNKQACLTSHVRTLHRMCVCVCVYVCVCVFFCVCECVCVCVSVSVSKLHRAVGSTLPRLRGYEVCESWVAQALLSIVLLMVFTYAACSVCLFNLHTVSLGATP